MKILVVEDEVRMANAISEFLKRDHYAVDVENDGISGRKALLTGIYDAVILDVMLPGMDGFQIVREVRKSGITTPILMLTAKNELQDKVFGLDLGADDYLTKPFQVNELKARIRAITRRNRDVIKEELALGDLILDQKTCMLRCAASGKEIRLPDKEFHIMEYLIMNARQIISRELLALKIRGYENEAEYNNVEVYISFTRKK